MRCSGFTLIVSLVAALGGKSRRPGWKAAAGNRRPSVWYIGSRTTIAFSILLFLGPYAARAQHSSEDENGSCVTFVSHRSGNNLLYRIDLGGTKATPLFGGAIQAPAVNKGVALYREPHWTRQSPDGTLFASWAYDRGIPSDKHLGNARAMLWAGDTAGMWSQMANPDCHEIFAWAPDSKRLAFSVHSDDHNWAFRPKTQTTEIYVSGYDGSGFECVFAQQGIWLVSDWSPDGDNLLVFRETPGKPIEKTVHELFELQMNELRRARESAGVNILDADWIVQKSNRFLKPVACDRPEWTIWHPRYSRDGRKLAVLMTDPKRMYLDVEGRKPRALLGKIGILNLAQGTSTIVADFEDGIRGPICWTPSDREILFSRYLDVEDDREKSLPSGLGLSIWGASSDGTRHRFITTGWSPDCPRNRNPPTN